MYGFSKGEALRERKILLISTLEKKSCSSCKSCPKQTRSIFKKWHPTCYTLKSKSKCSLDREASY